MLLASCLTNILNISKILVNLLGFGLSCPLLQLSLRHIKHCSFLLSTCLGLRLFGLLFHQFLNRYPRLLHFVRRLLGCWCLCGFCLSCSCWLIGLLFLDLSFFLLLLFLLGLLLSLRGRSLGRFGLLLAFFSFWLGSLSFDEVEHGVEFCFLLQLSVVLLLLLLWLVDWFRLLFGCFSSRLSRCLFCDIALCLCLIVRLLLLAL